MARYRHTNTTLSTAASRSDADIAIIQILLPLVSGLHDFLIKYLFDKGTPHIYTGTHTHLQPLLGI